MRRSCGNTCAASQGGGYLYLELADAVDPGEHLVAGLDRADARGRAGENDVARLERVVLRKVGDLLGHGPDHLGEVRALALLAVDVEPDGALGGVADLRRRHQL